MGGSPRPPQVPAAPPRRRTVNRPEAVLTAALESRYRFERELGRGGMATVYLAHDLKHDRPVALKVLSPDLGAALGPERFQREIRLAARLQHPHILTVHDSGETAGHLWYAMPYVEGESLRDRLRREGQLGVEDALRITREAAQALQYAHDHGVVHRDIKPENLLLTKDGNTLVADFGIARAVGGDEHLTQTGMSVGTPAYMSPEQASGDKVLDARTDIYSLGAVLYEMLAGEPPFTGPSAQAIIVKRLTEPAPSVRKVRPSVPEEVDKALRRALAPITADRFSSIADLARVITAPSVSTPTPAATLQLATAGRWRKRVPAGVATLAMGFLLGLGVLFAWRRSHSGTAAGGKVIAVLPFENLGDTASDYFADGIADALRGKLASLSGMEVIARGSSVPYKRTRKPPEAIARELGARYLLTGTVRWEKGAAGAGRVLVSPELVEVTPGRAPRTRTPLGRRPLGR
jgi:eukaryotic-like serine/threonine-protein kinase